jgi:GH24 family phage-related lysozyme (muramidase)
MGTMSEEGLVNLTQPWEEFVPYPYDDLLRRVRGADGKYTYREWTGGPTRGTVTIGFGHTNAAGNLQIAVGMRLNEAQAVDLLLKDMAPVERFVDRHLKVDVTQHQYDCLADLAFNCPSAIPHVSRLVNAGKWPAAEQVMLEYVYSKGNRLPGLVRRRTAEIAWANTHDDKEIAAAAPKGSKAERKPPKIAAHHIGTAGAATVAGASGLVPVDLLHTHLFASLLGASTAFCAGLIWHGRWKR